MKRLNKCLFCFAILFLPVLSMTLITDLNLETDLPRGATFNSTTRVFSWIPDSNQVGNHRIKFKVCDNHGGCDEEIITVTVNATSGE